MKILNLKRTHRIVDGTFGTLDIEGIPFCQTVELPWKNNAENISHIPVGEYQCVLAPSKRWGYSVYHVQGVPNRSDVEIHIANTICDIEGCIGLGHGFGTVETKNSGILTGVQESKVIFSLFMAKMKNDPQFKLIITEV